MEKLGIQVKDMSSHTPSISMALALFLARHSKEQIQMLGRWKSLAFMLCVSYQVQELHVNTSQA